MAKAIKVLIACLIFWALFYHSQLKLGLLYTIYKSPFSSIAVIGLCYVMVILHSWRWYRLNTAQRIPLSFLRTIIPTYLGIAFNAVLPGSIGGDFLRLYLILKQFPDQKSSAALSIFVDKISTLMGMLVIVGLSAPYFLGAYPHNSTLYYLLLVCVSLCIGGGLVLLLTAFLFSEKTGLSAWIINAVSYTRLSTIITSLLESIHVYRNSKLIILETLLVSVTVQLFMLLVIIIIGNIMGLPRLHSIDYMLALVVAQVANLIPLTPGGIGVGEAAFANILILLNPSATAAYATAFLALRILSIVAYCPGMVLGIFRLHSLRDNKPMTVIEA